jgi:hypothetical protein
VIFVWGGWKKIEVYKRKVGARDELLARIWDAAARINKRDYVYKLRRTTWDLRRRVAENILDNGGIYEQSL